jgi:exodeoxyribonuclease V alpha subunit
VFSPCTDPETGQNIIVDLVTHLLPREGYSPDDIQILSPIKKPGVLCGCRELNAELRKRLNRPEHRVVIGDRVIQTKNDRERKIFNGELGIVVRADDEGFDVLFRGRRVDYNKQHFANRVEGPTTHLNWANAITVHKAQGSEFPVVIIPVFSAFSIMLTRNLYYTAVSRGQKKVIMVGDPAALKQASLNLRGKQRISKLAEFLNPERDWPSCGRMWGPSTIQNLSEQMTIRLAKRKKQ